jgi:hypothetical protein
VTVCTACARRIDSTPASDSPKWRTDHLFVQHAVGFGGVEEGHAAFAAVVRVGSFTRAAAQIGITQSAPSQTIRSLERRLDLKLLNRTTRSVSRTEAGEGSHSPRPGR